MAFSFKSKYKIFTMFSSGKKKLLNLNSPLPVPILSASSGKNGDSEQLYWGLISHLKGRPYCCLLRCVGDSALRPSTLRKSIYFLDKINQIRDNLYASVTVSKAANQANNNSIITRRLILIHH